MIRYAELSDLDIISQYDKHISKTELGNSIGLKRVLVMIENEKFVGWMRYNLFWDNTPFMNMLYFLEGERGKGYGSQMIEFWENEMKMQGYDAVLTSTQSNEEAQHFYRKHGYLDSGSLTLPGEPLEILFYKKL
ncbi:MAG: GNAT family N-acetyltransferase [Clostridia bacterium]|nr:GNAT family N-acetyltransferase [Clostridia bacterium]